MLCHESSAYSAQALQEEFDSERTDMTSSHNRQKKEMADLMAAMETEFAEADSEARQEFEAAREEIRNRSSEEYNVLKISLEGQIEELERTFEAAHQAYLQNTGARATAFQTLTTNDAAAARVIEQRMKKLVQMQVCLHLDSHVFCPADHFWLVGLQLNSNQTCMHKAVPLDTALLQ